MSSDVCWIGKGTFAYYGTLPASTDSLLFVLFAHPSGTIPTDAAIDACLTLSAIKALNGTTMPECTATNYARITDSTSNTVTVAATVTLDCADQTWASLGGVTNNTLVKCIVCYVPSSGAADTAIIPLGNYDFAATTDGSNLTAQINVSGLMSCT